VRAFNSQVTYVDKDAVINTTGDNSKVIVWADDTTRFYGSVLSSSFQGGGGGNSFVEVSGKNFLDFKGKVQTDTLLLDPTDILIKNGSGTSSPLFTGSVFDTDSGPTVIYESEIEALNGNTNILLEATNNITIEDLTGGILSLKAGSGSITFTADSDSDGFGDFLSNSGDTIKTYGRDFTTTAASINVGNISTATLNGNDGGNINLSTSGSIKTGDLNSSSQQYVSLNVNGEFNGNGNTYTTGKAGDINITSQNSSIETGNILALSGFAADYHREFSLLNLNIIRGDGGNINLNAKGDISSNQISSASADYSYPTSFYGYEQSNLRNVNYPVYSYSGDGGDISINSDGNLSAFLITSTSNSGRIFDDSQNNFESTSGNAGNIDLNIKGNLTSQYLSAMSEGYKASNGGNITATIGGDINNLYIIRTCSNGQFKSGNGGNIDVSLGGDLPFYYFSLASSSYSGGTASSPQGESGNAGNIKFHAGGLIDNLYWVEANSDSNGGTTGHGGNVDIKTGGTIKMPSGGYIYTSDWSKTIGDGTSGSISLESVNGSIDLTNVWQLSSIGQIDLKSKTGVFLDNGVGIYVQAPSDLNINTGGAFSMGTSSSLNTNGGNVNITAASIDVLDIYTNANTGGSTTGDISLTSTVGDIKFNRLLNLLTDTTNTSTGDITINSAGSVNGNRIDQLIWNTQINQSSGNIGDITIQAVKDIDITTIGMENRSNWGNQGSNGLISLNAGGSILVNELWNNISGFNPNQSTDGIQVTAQGNIEVGYIQTHSDLLDTNSLSGNKLGDVTITSTNGEISNPYGGYYGSYSFGTNTYDLNNSSTLNLTASRGIFISKDAQILYPKEVNISTTGGNAITQIEGKIIDAGNVNIDIDGYKSQLRLLGSDIQANNIDVELTGDFTSISMGGSTFDLKNNFTIHTDGQDGYIQLYEFNNVDPSIKVGGNLDWTTTREYFDYGSVDANQIFPIIDIQQGNIEVTGNINIKASGHIGHIYNNGTLTAGGDINIQALGTMSSFQNAGPTAIYTSNANTGTITSTNGNINLAASSDVILNGSVSGIKDIKLLADYDGDYNSALIINAPIVTAGTNQTVTLQGSEIDINASVDSGTNGTIVLQTSANKKFNIGGVVDNADTAGANGILDISAPEISRLTANHLEFKNTGNADMTLLGNLNLPIDSIKLNNVGNVLLSNKEVSANEAVRILGNYVSGLSLSQFPKITAPLIEITGNQVGSFPAPIGLKATDTNSYVFDSMNQTGRGQNYIYSLWPFLVNSNGFDLYPSGKLILPSITNIVNPFSSMMNASGGLTNSLLNYDNTKAPDTVSKKFFKFIYEVDKDKDGIFSTNDVVFEYTSSEEASALDLTDIIPEILKFEIPEGGIFDSKVQIIELYSGYERELKGKLELHAVSEDTIPLRNLH